MAKKKVTEEVNPEATTEVVEETPKTTKKKSTKKKVEEPVVEQAPDLPAVEEPVVEPTVEEILTPSVEDTQKVKDYFEKLDAEATEAPIVLEQVELVEEKPKKAKKAKADKVEEAPAAELPYKAKVTASIIHARKGPSMLSHAARDLYKGMTIVVSEINGNWAKVGKDLWVNINYIEKI